MNGQPVIILQHRSAKVVFQDDPYMHEFAPDVHPAEPTTTVRGLTRSGGLDVPGLPQHAPSVLPSAERLIRNDGIAALLILVDRHGAQTVHQWLRNIAASIGESING